jgi:dTDP-4-amino-4,6-dideoxygalactose transaminase
MVLFEDRAATVLYKVLTSLQNPKKFLLPLNICPIVPDTFLKANIDFEFIDINLETLCMDDKLALEKIKNDETIGGVLFVKTFGIEFDIQPFYKKIKEINPTIFIIDDMCLCIQRFDYDIENSYANMALFSSGYSKFVDIGYGGYCFLKDKNFSNIFEDMSNSKEFLEYKNTLQTQIPLMEKHKEELNSIYRENLPKELHLGEKFYGWRFSILVDNKEKILEEIFKIEGLFASSHYPQVDYAYSKNPIQNSNAQMIHNKIVNLFNDFRFNKEKAYQIVAIINNNLN